MNIIRAAIIAIILVLTLWLTGFAAAPPDILGTWLGKTEVPNLGLDEVTLVLAKDTDGMSGMLVDTLGLIAKDTAAKEIKLEGKELVFHFPLANGQDIWIKLAVDGDKMTGVWWTPEGGTGEIVFDRKK